MKHTLSLIFCLTFTLVMALAQSPAGQGLDVVEIKNPEGQAVGFYQESHALLIGVSEYTNGWPNLPGVKKDVRLVQAALEQNGFHVVTVMDPDKAQMDRAFDNFIQAYGGVEDNRLLFYFAGHGHSVTPKYGGKPLGYIVPKEAPNPHQDLAQFKNIAMSMQRIEEYALNIDAKHTLFLFDSCFSGSLFDLTRAIPEYISYKTSQPVRQFITAGDETEEVPDESIFRAQFIAALNGEGDVNEDGFVTGSELGEFLQTKVVNYSKGAQHPQYGKIRHPQLDKGDFVFELTKTQALLEQPKLVPPPKKKGFSLEAEIAEAEALEANKKAWEEVLLEMKEAFASVQLLESKSIAAEKKKSAWLKFKTYFIEDNPYSTEDETMREHAEARMKHWDSEALRLKQVAVKKEQAPLVKKEQSPLDDFLAICHNPTKAQKHTLNALAKQVEQSYSAKSCKALFQDLNKLTELNLFGYKLTDVSALQGLNNLTDLNLWGNQLTDVSALQGLNNLTSLGLNGNQLNDVSALQGLNNLTYLFLNRNQLTDVSALQGLNKLTYLYLNNNRLTDVSALQGLNKLSRLDLSDNRLNDVSTLQGLNNLTWLDLSTNPLKDCSPQNLEELKSGKSCLK